MDKSVVVIKQPATDARYEDGGDAGEVETPRDKSKPDSDFLLDGLFS